MPEQPPGSETISDASLAAHLLDGLGNPTAVRKLLINAAQRRQTLTYAQALAALGHRFTRPKMRLLCRIIGELDTSAAATGEPGLAALVVRASDGMPGEGWWRSQCRRHPELDICRSDALSFVRQRQAEAFDYWESAAII